MNVIELNQARRAFPTVDGWEDALHETSLQVEAGEVLGLLGRNGAGKTTLISLLLGIYPPDAGQVRVFGLDPREHPVEVKSRVGYVAEKQILPEFVRFQEVLAFHRKLFPTWDEEFAQELIASFDLGANMKKRLGDMSRGQAQQAALICAVAHKPELLLLDEPAAGLDPAARRQFLETTIQLLGQEAPTILFSSHHMNDVERLAQRIVILDKGRILLDDPIHRLQEQYSLAVFDRDSGATREDLLSIQGCLRVREQATSLRAVFNSEPAQIRALLKEQIGNNDAYCATLPLEELFVELVGGKG